MKFSYSCYLVKFLSIILVTSVYATDMTISSPGVYALNNNITSNPVAGSNNIINITSSNVVLDLKDFTISQANTFANFNGINIAPNLTNITIKNGTIKTLTGVGINVGVGCTKIVIDNIKIDSCYAEAILLGTFHGSNPVLNSQIINCTITKCANKNTAPIWLGTCQNCIVKNCVVSECGLSIAGGSDNQYGSVYLTYSSACILENIKMQNNSQYGAVTLWGSAGNTITDCIYTGAKGFLSFSGGYSLRGSSNGNLMKNCVAQANTASTLHGYFAIEISSTMNTLDGCYAAGNNIDGAIGVVFINIYSSDQNLITNCRVSGNVCNAIFGTMTGFNTLITNRTSFINCEAVNNTSSSPMEVRAMMLSGATYCEVSDSYFYNNSAGVDSLSWGIKTDSSCNNNLYSHVSSYANGPVNPIPGQQMSVAGTGTVVP